MRAKTDQQKRDENPAHNQTRPQLDKCLLTCTQNVQPDGRFDYVARHVNKQMLHTIEFDHKRKSFSVPFCYSTKYLVFRVHSTISTIRVSGTNVIGVHCIKENARLLAVYRGLRISADNCTTANVGLSAVNGGLRTSADNWTRH